MQMPALASAGSRAITTSSISRAVVSFPRMWGEAAAGGLTDSVWKVLSGGPMMGVAQGDLSYRQIHFAPSFSARFPARKPSTRGSLPGQA